MIPLSSPKQTLINPIKVIKEIIIIWLEKLWGIEKTYSNPELIWIVPNPKEVVTPRTVVSIAIISIDIANSLLLEILGPNKELTLNGSFLLYEANAKHSPRRE